MQTAPRCMGQLLWKTIEKPAVIPIGTGNHHPNCRKPGPGSGGKSTFPCHFFFKEGNDLFFSVELFYLFMAALGLYCCAQAQLPQGMWHLPRPGIEPVSSALTGRFLTTVPPEKSSPVISMYQNYICNSLGPFFTTHSLFIGQNEKGGILKRATSFSFILSCYNK